ncbi:MAG: PEP-CTERM sorting domain-containing protein [Acidobacteria bacterium]|nr:PEP-CTERM sorting domain-containing protein [Acidobacteriota bacterium]
MKKALMTLALAAAFVPTGSAATLCSSLIGSDITTISACTAGFVTFSDFDVDFGIFDQPPASSVSLTGVTVDNGGADVYLKFQISHSPSPATTAGDILITYTAVSGGAFRGFDVGLGTTVPPVTITENICTPGVNPLLNPCGSIIGELQVYNNPGSNDKLTDQTFLTPGGNSIAGLGLHEVFLQKDIQIGQNASISEFTNSHHVVPEPGTVLLMGSALIGLAALRRRKQQ